MDVIEEFEDEEVRSQVGYLAQEMQETFAQIRRHTNSDLGAWFVVQEWREWRIAERVQAESKKGGSKPISEAQLKLLGKKGVASLADLSRKQAQSLIESFEFGDVAEDEEGHY